MESPVRFRGTCNEGHTTAVCPFCVWRENVSGMVNQIRGSDPSELVSA